MAERLAAYRRALRTERACTLVRADLLVELIDGHGLRAIDIARQTGERPSDLSQMYRTAKAFPAGARPEGVAYNVLLLGARMARRFPEAGLRPAEAVAEIRRAGLSQHRDVGRHFGDLVRRAMQGRAPLPAPADPGQVFGRAHCCRFQDLLERFPDGSIKLLGFDPPYVYADETRRSRIRGARCDHGDDPAAALAQVLDLLRDGLPKLAAGGVLLLWQPWQGLLRPIDDAAAAGGWAVEGPVIWDKGRPQPGRLDGPYGTQGEMLWVLHRPGDVLENHDGGSRGMILRFPPVGLPRRAGGRAHGYEKPLALCEHLVLKHTRPGDVVFDACGCTGGMSVAAIAHGRRWAYAESDAGNHRLGAARIAKELARAAAPAAG